jgi:hypothetical protein
VTQIAMQDATIDDVRVDADQPARLLHLSPHEEFDAVFNVFEPTNPIGLRGPQVVGVPWTRPVAFLGSLWNRVNFIQVHVQ